MEIREVPINELNPAKYNPRKDLKPDDPEYIQLEKSIKEFGNVDPIIWNEKTGNIVGGHQRFKILINSLKAKDKLAVSVVKLSERKEKMLNIALNKISGYWDYGMLRDLISIIDIKEFEHDIIGYDDGELEKFLDFDLGNIDPGKQAEPKNASEKFVEIYLSSKDLSDFEPTLKEWSNRESVTLNIS